MDIPENRIPDITDPDLNAFNGFLKHEGTVFGTALRNGDISGAEQSFDRLMDVLGQMTELVKSEVPRRFGNGTDAESSGASGITGADVVLMQEILKTVQDNFLRQKETFRRALQEGLIISASEIHARTAAMIYTLAAAAFTDPDFPVTGIETASAEH